MGSVRSDFTLTLLSDGRVLASGGSDATRMDYVPYSATEIFDPYTLSWSPGPDLAIPRTKHSATLLADGTVLVAGGIGPATGEQDVRAPTPTEIVSTSQP